MENSPRTSDHSVFVNRALEAAIRIGLVALLVTWCFLIIKAFVVPVLWGVVIAIAVYPFYLKLVTTLGKREKLAATLLTLFAFALLIIPTVLLTDSTVGGIRTLSRHLQEGTLAVPPPSDNVATWPIIGKPLADIWQLASVNIGAALKKLEPQLKAYGPKLLSAVAGLGLAFVQFVISIVIAGAFLVNARSGERTAHAIFTRLAGEQGEAFSHLASATVRSVVQGVLGVAIIQSALSGLGLMAVGVPAAGLWALIVLFVAVIQLPPILILGPIIFYVFLTSSTTLAVIFMIWSILVSMSDSFLKPLFLGRGVDVPMLVILLGAIGGMMSSGILGLFVGPVVLSLGYKIFQTWLIDESAVVPTSGLTDALESDDGHRGT
ncbi:MAG: AI-2E family transporter [bacterium]|nr:AI-2E family transporter [bacterium]